MTNQLFGLEICAVRQDTFHPRQDYEQVNFYKKSSLRFNDCSVRNWKIAVFFNWLNIGTFQPKFDKNYIFYQHFQPLYDVMQKEIESLEFVRGVIFEFIDSLKNSGTKYLLICDDSCEEICNSKAFVDIATAGRHRGLSAIYNKHNLFHQKQTRRRR